MDESNGVDDETNNERKMFSKLQNSAVNNAEKTSLIEFSNTAKEARAMTGLDDEIRKENHQNSKYKLFEQTDL